MQLACSRCPALATNVVAHCFLGACKQIIVPNRILLSRSCRTRNWCTRSHQHCRHCRMSSLGNIDLGSRKCNWELEPIWIMLELNEGERQQIWSPCKLYKKKKDCNPPKTIQISLTGRVRKQIQKRWAPQKNHRNDHNSPAVCCWPVTIATVLGCTPPTSNLCMRMCPSQSIIYISPCIKATSPLQIVLNATQERASWSRSAESPPTIAARQ